MTNFAKFCTFSGAASTLVGLSAYAVGAGLLPSLLIGAAACCTFGAIYHAVEGPHGI